MEKGDLSYLTSFMGVLHKRTQFDAELPDEELTSLAKLYSDRLNYRISIFLRGKKQGTPEYTVAIIKYLLENGRPLLNDDPSIQYRLVPLKDMNKALVSSRGVGRPNNPKPVKPRSKTESQSSKPIEYYSTLVNILKKLVDEGIIERKEVIERHDRSSPEKKKTNTYYRIRNEVINLPIVHATETTEPDRQALRKRGAQLHEMFRATVDVNEKKRLQAEISIINSQLSEAANASTPKEVVLSQLRFMKNALEECRKSSDHWYREALLIQRERDACIELLKEYGITDPVSAIQQRIHPVIQAQPKKYEGDGTTKKTGLTEQELIERSLKKR